MKWLYICLLMAGCTAPQDKPQTTSAAISTAVEKEHLKIAKETERLLNLIELGASQIEVDTQVNVIRHLTAGVEGGKSRQLARDLTGKLDNYLASIKMVGVEERFVAQTARDAKTSSTWELFHQRALSDLAAVKDKCADECHAIEQVIDGLKHAED
jgi:hypothetical protein